MLNSNTKSNTTILQMGLPLDFTFSFEKDVPENDISRIVIQIVERINIGKYIDLTNRETHGYDGVMLFKLIMLAFAEDGYASTRQLENKCRFDLRYRYIAKEATPSHSAFQRFIHDDLRMGIEDIFYDINQLIEEELALDTTVLLIDGSKFEANANKNTFIWKKNTTRFYQRNWMKVNELMKRMNRYFEEERNPIRCSILKEPSLEYLLEITTELEKYINEKDIKFVHGRGNKKPEIQRYYEELRELALKLWEYTIQYDLLDGRNSCSKTDPDATFMHMKYDYYNHTNVFKPGYNVQLGISSGYIRAVYVNGDGNDIKTYQPILESYYEAYGKYPKKVVADAGYGSYDNYVYSEVKGIEPFVSYSGYYKEQKNSKKDTYKRFNFKKNATGTITCPEGKELVLEKVTVDKRTRYLKVNERYRCQECTSCPSKKECTRSKIGRTITYCNHLERYHEEVKRKLLSEEGKRLQRERRIYSEGAFGNIKENYGYSRIQRRGLTGVKSELLLVSIGFNIRKYQKSIEERSKEEAKH